MLEGLARGMDLGEAVVEPRGLNTLKHSAQLVGDGDIIGLLTRTLRSWHNRLCAPPPPPPPGSQWPGANSERNGES